MDTNQQRENLILSYDRQAEQRNKGGMEDWKITDREKFLKLSKGEQKNSLLEIGAGHGRDSKFFQDNGLQVTCIDLALRWCGFANKKD